MSPSAEEVPAPPESDLRPQTGRYRPCFKPVLITIGGRGRFGILRAWLRAGDGWLCHVEYMNDGHGSTNGWYRFDEPHPASTGPALPVLVKVGIRCCLLAASGRQSGVEALNLAAGVHDC